MRCTRNALTSMPTAAERMTNASRALTAPSASTSDSPCSGKVETSRPTASESAISASREPTVWSPSGSPRKPRAGQNRPPLIVAPDAWLVKSGAAENSSLTSSATAVVAAVSGVKRPIPSVIVPTTPAGFAPAIFSTPCAAESVFAWIEPNEPDVPPSNRSTAGSQRSVSENEPRRSGRPVQSATIGTSNGMPTSDDMSPAVLTVIVCARDASELFLAKLAGVTDPEQKRKAIGATFIDVFDEEAHRIGGVEFLAQGTLYPDVIESVSATGGPSVTIKSHHNVGGLPACMKLALVEPLRELFKDEVRALGRELGLPEDFVDRHPFPGPGLAIRVPGEVTRDKLDILRKADAVFLEEIRNAGLYDAIWQAFAVLLPVKTVGVMGDARSYEFVCALRAVTSTDGMTADYYPFTHEILGRAATRIINEVRGINRVVYDITSKPPGTIEWE